MVQRKKAASQSSELKTSEEPSVSINKTPLVFISHDGRDADLAEAFSNLLTDASGGILKSFRSSDKKGTAGIEFGAEWYSTIMESLNCATDVVAILTRHSVDRPWILYEAGVAKGKLGTTVFGVAIGVPLGQASTGPFAQFQNCADDEESLTKLVVQLITKNIPNASPRREAVERQVRAFREHVTSLIKNKPKGAASDLGRVDETSIAKLFEEVKVMFATLPERMDQKLQASQESRGNRRRIRIHPRAFEELLFYPSPDNTRDGNATRWLMFISTLRDDFPWFYEMGLELYHALKSNNDKRIDVARKDLINSLEMVTHSLGPMRRITAFDSQEAEMAFDVLPRMIDEFLRRNLRFESPKQSKNRSRTGKSLKP